MVDQAGVPWEIYNDQRSDLEKKDSVIQSQITTIANKQKEIDELKDAMKLLPAPEEWQKAEEAKAQVRAKSSELIKELKTLQGKKYNIFGSGKSEDNKRKEEILADLDDLNSKLD